MENSDYQILNIDRGGVQQVSNQLSKNAYRSYENFSTKVDTSKLHPGEIVHGTIIDIFSNNEVLVQLPIGTLSANLQGTLQKNDSLLLKIIEVNPVLILKIFAVPILTDGKLLSNDEILRILNVPQNNFFRELISFLKIYQSTITSQELLMIYNYFPSLKNIEKNRQNINDIFRALYFINGLSLSFSENIFKKLMPALSNSNLYSNYFQLLAENIDSLPEPAKSELKEFITLISKRDLAYISTAFSLKEFSNPKHLINILNSLNDSLLSETNPIYNEIKKNINNLLNLFESQYTYNSIALINNLPYIFFFPYFYNGKFKIMQLKIRKLFKDAPKKQKAIKFSFTIHTDNLSDIKVLCDFFNNILDIKLFLSNNEQKEMFEQEISNLKLELSKINISINKFQLTEMRLSDEMDILIHLPQSNQQNFTYVI